jgi:chemotaxis protein CheY-P-specific phosphatase CheC
VKLSELQRDALGEMANISASRAAKQLSALLGDSIDITVPRVELLPLPALRERLSADGDGTIACVYQALSGVLQGRVHLMFHNRDSKALIHALVGDAGPMLADALREYEHEAMTEVGNIIIATFAAMLADLLGAELRLSLPYYNEGSVEELMFNLPAAEDAALMVVVVIETVLRAAQRDVSGTLMVVLKVHSAEELLSRIDAMLQQIGVEA